MTELKLRNPKTQLPTPFFNTIPKFFLFWGDQLELLMYPGRRNKQEFGKDFGMVRVVEDGDMGLTRGGRSFGGRRVGYFVIRNGWPLFTAKFSL